MLTQSLILALATQLATIEGQVRDARTHAAIPFARIELWRGQIPVDQRYTDADGKFRFAQLASSRYTIAVDYVGYESSSIELDLTSSVFPAMVGLVRKKTAGTNLRPVISVREYLVPKKRAKRV
jgi:hypothetical protein